MKIEVNIDNLLDTVMNADSEYQEYRHSIARYGKPINLDRLENNEERHIAYYYRSSESSRDQVYTIRNIFRMDGETEGRMYIAARAARRWYERTEWQRFLPEDLQERLGNFIFKGNGRRSQKGR